MQMSMPSADYRRILLSPPRHAGLREATRWSYRHTWRLIFLAVYISILREAAAFELLAFA